jgi:hypothetical protein
MNAYDLLVELTCKLFEILDFHGSFADPESFVPVKPCFANASIFGRYASKTFHLQPATIAESAPQSGNLSDCAADSDGLAISNWTQRL